MNRYSDIDWSFKRLPPVYGYQTEKLVSIEKALEPIESQIVDLPRFIKRAKRRCRSPSEHDLSEDQSAAVYIYTMEWNGQTLYRVLNEALRSENRETIKKWFSYLKLFDTALNKLPTVKEVVWRGVPIDIGNNFTKNQIVTWWSINSCSSSVGVIKNFLSQNKTSTLFLIEAVNGKKVSGYTEFKDEEEVILRMGTQFRVKSNALDHQNGSHVVHLVEIDDNEASSIEHITTTAAYTDISDDGSNGDQRANESSYSRRTSMESTDSDQEAHSDQSDTSITTSRLRHRPSQEVNSLIKVWRGDLIEQSTDVIVVCSSSQYLFNSICQAGGDSVSTSYNVKVKKKSKDALISVKAAGELGSKRIYFLPWRATSDKSVLGQSIEKFVSDAVEKAVEENYKSLAFPAIGCGKFGCPISLVAETMVREAHRKSQMHNVSISFIIEPGRDDIYDEFKKQIKLGRTISSVDTLAIISATVGKGVIEVVKGDITRQKVDVVVGSSSSSILLNTILKAAGKSVETEYNVELKNHPNATLIVTSAGSLKCKNLFFVTWTPDSDENTLRISLIDLMSIVAQHAKSHNFTSIAFPAIGCGLHGCSVNLVVETMVLEMKKYLIARQVPWTIKFIIQSNQENVYDEFCTQVLKTQDGLHASETYKVPSHWTKSTDDTICFPLSTRSDEYKSIQTKFEQDMKGSNPQIIRIERIQNERWYMQYLAHSKDFQKRLKIDFEKRLYHGCPEHAANSIIADGFNRSFAGVNGVVYGVGVYFSSRATYSHTYAAPSTNGERRMFVVRVLVGQTTLGNSSMKVRPVGFDSTTDNDHIFVTYHDAQALAEYLITYK